MNNQSLATKIQLKGGSLSGTYLCVNDFGQTFVRKECSLIENREYGFQRWYSQLKRLQRYEFQFPGLFPNVLRFGKNDQLAYFDIDYVENACTIHEFLSENPSQNSIKEMFLALTLAMERLHSNKFPSSTSAIDLYLHEEVFQKILACSKNPRFQILLEKRFINFNGSSVPGIYWELDNFNKKLKDLYLNPSECFTHGNITLENVLYNPVKQEITFIDPYEENIIDSKLAEYSQILQSSNSHYELYNSSTPIIENNGVEVAITVPDGLKNFNSMFHKFISNKCKVNEIEAISLFEITQYLRMLPFKMAIDENKMVLFYCLASYLYDRFLKQEKD